mgnify:CR=1 FL=1
MSADLDKNWIDVLSALLTPTIAIVGIAIGWQQSCINKKRLQNELFNRRIDLYGKIASYIANILTRGSLENGAETQFFRDTKHVTFIFGKDIEKLVNEIYNKSLDLNLLKTQAQPLQDKAHSKQREIKKSFENEINNVQKRFIKYLKL